MSLNDVFDVEDTCKTVANSPVQPVCVQAPVDNTIVEYDYQSARSNLYSVLQQGEDALLHALELAKAKEEPRAFEVVGGLLKNLADINTQLLELSEKRQKLIEKEKREVLPSPTSVTNNAIFVGSTDELNKMLQKMKGE
jgi:hypothetical protein